MSGPPDAELPLRASTASEPSEATLLMHAVKRGEAQAFDTLVRRARGRAFQVANTLVGSRDDAMELVQESFLKVWRARDTFRDGERFAPWFHRILRNTCFSFLRKRGRLRKSSLSAAAGAGDDEGDWEIADAAPAPESGIEADERAESLRRALAAASARDREILVLRHFQELSYQAIAEQLEVPVGTVMSRLFHARRRLREALADELGEDL